MMNDTDRRIQREMMRAGYSEAAANFPERWAYDHSPRDKERLTRYWLS